MTSPTEQLAASLDALTLRGFEAFCEDIASMFGNTAECAADSAGQGPLSDLKKEFKKLASVNQVQAQGVLDGSFQLFLDQAGLFILAGVFVMLPEKRVLETIRGGTLKDADYINDAIKEVGNLLIGSWDRVFREEQKGHKHFQQTGTFVGSIWDNPEENIGLVVEQPCRYVVCRMKVDNFPEFKCAAVFSEQLFAAEDPLQAPQDAEPAAAPEPEPQTEPKATPLPEITYTEDNPGPVVEAIRQMTQPIEQNEVTGATVSAPAQALPTLSAGQVMNPAVLWVDPEDTVEDVLRQMQQHNIGYVLAGRDGQIEGLISRSDIAAAISPYTRPVFSHWRRPMDDAALQIRIKWFMSRPVHTIRPDVSLQTVMETMLRCSVRGLPVVDAGGTPLGLVSAYDVFGALLADAGVSMSGRPQQAPCGG